MSVSTEPRTRGKNVWSKLIWTASLAVLSFLVLVLVAKWLRTVEPVQSFITDYPGDSALPIGTPAGLPWWLGWQHFFNAFLLLLIIRSGWLVRTTQRPGGHWTRNNNGLIRTKNPPTKISLDLWLHLTLDALWVLNGLAFVILLVATGHWARIVPTGWDVFPNALSAALQYASLNWPTENGWVNYNSLQLLAYFTVVFVAAPLAIITGLRMSPAWPKQAKLINRIYPVEAARAIHLPVMFFFAGFILIHVTLVLATGALRNLNHMYASQDDGGWVGFWIFAASIAIMVASWILARPLFIRPIASLTGKVTR